MRLAVVLVHYRTPELLARAVAALNAELAGSGLDADLIVVDNGGEAAGGPPGLPVRWLAAGRNLGYAGGLNLGVSKTRADVLLLMNPDVEVLPGCLAALVGALAGGAAVAGPRFYWEPARQLMLPPTEVRSRPSELLRRLATHGERWAARVRRRWRRHARRHWLAAHAFPSLALSGALLAVRRDAWERVGPFDEGFPLYFEETDWLKRLARQGLTAWYVPAAAAVHRYNQSGAREPRAAAWFAESAARFERRHYGAWFSWLMRCVPDRGTARLADPPALARGLPAIDLSGSPRPAPGPLWVEVSPSRLGFPAAAAIVAGDPPGTWRFPAAAWEYLTPGAYRLQTVDAAGRELARYAFHRLSGPEGAGAAPAS
jgi:GT2 family glycosyltransferase